MKAARFLIAPVCVFVALVTSLHSQAQAPATASPQASQGAGDAPHLQVPDNSKPSPNQNQLPPISITSGLVHLVVTVTDRHRSFITDLDQGDFKVLENGNPQDIRFFGRETDLPLRIGLLLDTSNSIRERLSFEQEAAIDFLNRTIRRNKDMAFLMTFDNEPEVVQNFTGDLALLTDAIHNQRAGGGTALHDAIYRASEILSNPPLPLGPDPEVRRVIVVISDGDDNLSDHALSEALESAIRSEIAIYAISTNTDWLAIDDASHPSKYHYSQGDAALRTFTDQTGGRCFFPYKIDDLAQSFVDIGDELRSQYYIAYAPTIPLSRGQYRKIDVQTNRKGAIVRTRKGYYAVPSGLGVSVN
jgi:Ca-activated chloride channel family protein